MTTENISERSEHYLGHRVVVAYINTMKTTLDFNFNLYQDFKHGMNTRKLVIRKKLVNNQNLNKNNHRPVYVNVSGTTSNISETLKSFLGHF